MISMLRRPYFRLLVSSLALILFALPVCGQKATGYRGRKYKAPPQTARVEVTILRDVNGKPIENAAVIFHPIAGEVSKGNMELKTNEDGKTVIDVLPIGDTVRLQIIAKGFQTYGADFKVDKAEMALEIRLKRPGEQYSIYKDHPGEEKKPDADKPADQPAGAGKDDPKPADKPDSQSSQPQAPPK